jgi:signal transduction histidine kinase
MKLTARFLLTFVIALAVSLGATTYLAVLHERSALDRDLRTDSLLVGRLVARAYDLAMHAGDVPAAVETIAAANQIQTGLTVQRIPVADNPLGAREMVEAGEPAAVRDDAAKPDGVLDTFVPLHPTDGEPAAALRVRVSLRVERGHDAEIRHRAIVSSVTTLLLAAAAISVLGVIFIARPTRALIDKTRRVGRGDLGEPLHLRQRDELGDLAEAVNAMAADLAAAQARAARESDARVAAVEQLRHADRLMTVGRLSAGIAHELGTPLNVIEGRAKMIQQGDVEGDEVVDSARIVVEQSRRITRIIRQLLDFARRGERERRPVDIVAIARQSERLLSSTAKNAGVEIIGPAREEPLEVLGDEAQLVQVITNLVVNAIHATQPGGRVTIDVRATESLGVVEVLDNGSGMDAATRERIFEPFFTTKDVGEGTGLGLSVVHGIVQDHGGRVEVESRPGAGSRFSVYLPVPES